MKPLVFIKIGGSLITEKEKAMTAKPGVIKQIAKQIAQVQKEMPDSQIILGNGAGSFGHFQAKEYGVHLGMKTTKEMYGYAVVQDAVAQLNRLVVSALLQEGVMAVSVQPSACMTANNREPQETFVSAVFGFLEKGIIPVVYGDIILDATLGCSIYSTEKVFEILINVCQEDSIPVSKVIHLSKVDGVYNAEKNVIAEITPANWGSLQKHIYITEGYDVTGGMKHKIEEGLSFATKGIDTHIVNGEKEDCILNIFKNKPTGTKISSQQSAA